MSIETLWIPSIGEYISVPNLFYPNERSVMGVNNRVKKDGKRFIQCGEHLFPLEVCHPPRWIPKPGDQVRATICRYEGRVNRLFVHDEQGYVMADCRMYRQPNGKPVEPCFREWSSTLALLEPIKGGQAWLNPRIG